MEKSCCNENIKGFTLIEVLVVVLIIGILAAIALPQYQKAVEKSHAAEALANIRTIVNNVELCHLQNGTNGICSVSPAEWAIDLTGGTWQNVEGTPVYVTKYFAYSLEDGAGIIANRCKGTCPTPFSWDTELEYWLWGDYPTSNDGSRAIECNPITSLGVTICEALGY